MSLDKGVCMDGNVKINNALIEFYIHHSIYEFLQCVHCFGRKVMDCYRATVGSHSVFHLTFNLSSVCIHRGAFLNINCTVIH